MPTNKANAVFDSAKTASYHIKSSMGAFAWLHVTALQSASSNVRYPEFYSSENNPAAGWPLMPQPPSHNCPSCHNFQTRMGIVRGIVTGVDERSVKEFGIGLNVGSHPFRERAREGIEGINGRFLA